MSWLLESSWARSNIDRHGPTIPLALLYCHHVFHLAKSLPNCTGLNRLGEYEAGRIQNVKEHWNFCQTGWREAPRKMLKRILVWISIHNATHGCEIVDMWTSPSPPPVPCFQIGRKGIGSWEELENYFFTRPCEATMSEAANARLCEQHLHFHLIATCPMVYLMYVIILMAICYKSRVCWARRANACLMKRL